MSIQNLISAKAELTDGGLPAEPIVLSTRIRLARNLNAHWFPGRASTEQALGVYKDCVGALEKLEALKQSYILNIAQMENLSRQVLVERRLISRELTEAGEGAGVVISRNQHLSVMVNEEDHLRLQVVRSGFNFRKTWAEINAVDSELENHLDYAFSHDFGYLTACPTNLGTGMRASAMLHLPGLVMGEHMEKVVRMVNQLGLAVRGCFGEGSEATGSIFQISNQQTLGECEDAIINRLINILHAIIEQEYNARGVLLEQKTATVFDKIGRAYGVLTHAHMLSSEEAMAWLSLMRLAVDFGMLPDDSRCLIDRLMMETQPGHIQYAAQSEIEPEKRDVTRARIIREHLRALPDLNFDIRKSEKN